MIFVLYSKFLSSETQNALKSPPYYYSDMTIYVVKTIFFIFPERCSPVLALSKKRVKAINTQVQYIYTSFSKLLETATYGIVSNCSVPYISEKLQRICTSLYENRVRLGGNEQLIIETIYNMIVYKLRFSLYNILYSEIRNTTAVANIVQTICVAHSVTMVIASIGANDLSYLYINETYTILYIL